MPVPTPGRIAKQFTAHYLPIVDLNTGAVAGFEALARVVKANGSITSAGGVIEQIERRSDTLKVLIRTILASIRRDMVPLFERHQHFYVSVNIPPVILGSGEVLRLVKELKLTPHLSRIACEVTERQALTALGRSALDRARRSGMSVAIDDFGTGHSGLMQIAGLDFDILKIDHSLINTILTNQTAGRMLRGIVALAAALRLHTVAEEWKPGKKLFFFVRLVSIVVKVGFGVGRSPRWKLPGCWRRVILSHGTIGPGQKNLERIFSVSQD